MWHADGVKPDAAEVDRLADAAAIVLPALTEWLRFADVTAPARSRTDWQSMLDQPLPKDGAGFEAALSELAKWVVPNGLPVGAPGFTGFITTGPTTSAAVAQLAATVASPQRYAVSAFNLLEAVSLRWLAETCALPSDLTGVYSSGGSTANLLALGAARQAAFERRGVDVARDGLPARTVGAVYASAEAHHTIQRAAGVLGLGREGVRRIPADDRQRMDARILAEVVARDVADGVVPVAIVATAGTTNTGAIDPVDAVADVADRHDVWLHVDGAYGALFVLSRRVRDRLVRCGAADSIALDPHKLLFAPLEAGCLLVRDRESLARAFRFGASYLAADSDPLLVNFMDYGPELSRRFRAFKIWCALRAFGVRAFECAADRALELALYMRDRIRETSAFELMAPVELSSVCLRLRALDDAGNHRVLTTLAAEGTALLGPVRLGGRTGIRCCIANYRTTRADIDLVLERLLRLA